MVRRNGAPMGGDFLIVKPLLSEGFKLVGSLAILYNEKTSPPNPPASLLLKVAFFISN